MPRVPVACIYVYGICIYIHIYMCLYIYMFIYIYVCLCKEHFKDNTTQRLSDVLALFKYTSSKNFLCHNVERNQSIAKECNAKQQLDNVITGW